MLTLKPYQSLHSFVVLSRGSAGHVEVKGAAALRNWLLKDDSVHGTMGNPTYDPPAQPATTTTLSLPPPPKKKSNFLTDSLAVHGRFYFQAYEKWTATKE